MGMFMFGRDRLVDGSGLPELFDTTGRRVSPGDVVVYLDGSFTQGLQVGVMSSLWGHGGSRQEDDRWLIDRPDSPVNRAVDLDTPNLVVVDSVWAGEVTPDNRPGAGGTIVFLDNRTVGVGVVTGTTDFQVKVRPMWVADPDNVFLDMELSLYYGTPMVLVGEMDGTGMVQQPSRFPEVSYPDGEPYRTTVTIKCQPVSAA